MLHRKQETTREKVELIDKCKARKMLQPQSNMDILKKRAQKIEKA